MQYMQLGMSCKCIHDMMILKRLNFLDAKSVFMDGMHVEEPFKVIKMLRISIGSTEISTKLFPLYLLTYTEVQHIRKNLFRFEIKALKDLFFVGRGNSQKVDDIGHDFALMVHSNHTISTWGSFSHWMAVLNHGEKYGVPAMHGFL